MKEKVLLAFWTLVGVVVTGSLLVLAGFFCKLIWKLFLTGWQLW
jgi:hypothetical protein